MGGGQDRHVIQMIANASLDVIEDVMRKENTMCVAHFTSSSLLDDANYIGISSLLTNLMNGLCLHLSRLEVRLVARVLRMSLTEC